MKSPSVIKIPYGIDAEIALPGDKVLAACGTPSVDSIENVADATVEALRNPIDFPPLSEATFPGDRVTILLEDGVPYAPDIVKALVAELLTIGIEAEHICVVRSKQTTGQKNGSPVVALPVEIRNRIRLVAHEPDDRNSLAFIGPAKNDDAIYVNRELADADVVIPIGLAKPRSALGYFGVHGSIIPFADISTQKRFFKPKSSMVQKKVEKRLEEVKEINWTLGSRITLQVVPGSGKNVLKILAGDADRVQQHTDRLCDENWRFTVENRTSLVVATMTGCRQQQSWIELARAIRSASNVVEPDGAIAICSDLKARPGAAIMKLVGADSLDEAERSISKEPSSDALAAIQIARALEHTRIYLLSEFDEEFVEDLGMAYVASPAEIARLAGRHESCIALANAQNSIVELSEERLTC